MLVHLPNFLFIVMLEQLKDNCLTLKLKQYKNLVNTKFDTNPLKHFKTLI